MLCAMRHITPNIWHITPNGKINKKSLTFSQKMASEYTYKGMCLSVLGYFGFLIRCVERVYVPLCILTVCVLVRRDVSHF